MRLYVKRGCPWCVDAASWLRSRGLSFEEIDVLADREAFGEMIRISLQSKAPVLILEDGRMLADFGAEDLPGFLGTA